MKADRVNAPPDLAAITDACLERLAAAEDVTAALAECRARYPDVAEQLAPLLAAAVQLRALSQARLTDGQRLRAKVALRAELARRPVPGRAARGWGITGWARVGWARVRVAPLAAVVAVLLFVSVAVSAVAASQPGDLAYPVRVAVERAPALVQADPARGAAAELAVADRRLSDITDDDAAHPAAVNALLSSDQAAVERAGALSAAEQAQIAARVASHAATLGHLAEQSADPTVAERLRAAADRALALTGHAPPVVGAPTPSATPSAPPRATSAAGRVTATGHAPTGSAPTGSAPTATATPPPTATNPPEPTAMAEATPAGPAPASLPTATATATARPRPRLNITPPAPTPAAPPETPTETPTDAATARPRPRLTERPTADTPRPRPTLTPTAEHTPRPRPTLDAPEATVTPADPTATATMTSPPDPLSWLRPGEGGRGCSDPGARRAGPIHLVTGLHGSAVTSGGISCLQDATSWL